ncbi:hypothetical protein BA895_21760 [Humibacillus sp. DSM 29435]|nr:hypothetical protein BA895_21760 [Humibacillus sp. DSM 29435]
MVVPSGTTIRRPLALVDTAAFDRAVAARMAITVGEMGSRLAGDVIGVVEVFGAGQGLRSVAAFSRVQRQSSRRRAGSPPNPGAP